MRKLLIITLLFIILIALIYYFNFRPNLNAFHKYILAYYKNYYNGIINNDPHYLDYYDKNPKQVEDDLRLIMQKSNIIHGNKTKLKIHDLQDIINHLLKTKNEYFHIGTTRRNDGRNIIVIIYGPINKSVKDEIINIFNYNSDISYNSISYNYMNEILNRTMTPYIFEDMGIYIGALCPIEDQNIVILDEIFREKFKSYISYIKFSANNDYDQISNITDKYLAIVCKLLINNEFRDEVSKYNNGMLKADEFSNELINKLLSMKYSSTLIHEAYHKIQLKMNDSDKNIPHTIQEREIDARLASIAYSKSPSYALADIISTITDIKTIQKPVEALNKFNRDNILTMFVLVNYLRNNNKYRNILFDTRNDNNLYAMIRGIEKLNNGQLKEIANDVFNNKLASRMFKPYHFNYKGTAKKVAVEGTFNEGFRDYLNKHDGFEWSITIPLFPGRYKYRFKIDGVPENKWRELNAVYQYDWTHDYSNDMELVECK